MILILDTGNTQYHMVGSKEVFGQVSSAIERGHAFEVEYELPYEANTGRYILRVGAARSNYCTVSLALGDSND